nr:dihydrofolate reductase [Actinomycetales bacterium]
MTDADARVNAERSRGGGDADRAPRAAGEKRGKVVVNRSMSLDGFIAGPGHDMDPIVAFNSRMTHFVDIMNATGAMLIGRTTHEVARRMAPEDREYEGGAQFVITHEPPDDPVPGITYLTGDLPDAVETALTAAGGLNLEILGADLASQCLRAGLVDEVLVYVLPVLFGDGVRFSTPELGRIELDPVEVRHADGITVMRYRVRT